MRELGEEVNRPGQRCGEAGGGVRWGQESPECPDTPARGRGALGDPPDCLVSGTVPPRQGGRAWRLGGGQESCLLPRVSAETSAPPRPALKSHPQGDGT